MTLLSEKRDVQDALVNYLMGIGWQYLPPGDVAQRRGNDETEPFLLDVLREQLQALNPGLVTAENVDEVVRRLRLIRPSLAGNEAFVDALRGRWTVYDEQEKRERNLTLINYDDLRANEFHFTQELPFAGRDRRRMDMVLWVNGLPIAVIENKSPTVAGAELEAFDQVQRVYTDRIPDFIKYPVIMFAAATRLHYAPTWNSDGKAMNRAKAQDKDYGLERLSKRYLDRKAVLDMVRDHVVFYRADDQTSKFVLRPHQIRAVDKIVRRVLEDEAQTGLEWHTQGSGKTLTMIVAASVLRRELAARHQNPTLLIVVDRRELESQMVQNLEAIGFPSVTRARTRRHLRELLGNDYRGLIVTLVHKFDRMPKNRIERKSVVVLIDEAHRTQEGDLATYMRAALPNAYYFGFTGTPIDRGQVGRGTFETFGGPDEDGYHDRYGMDESIEDGTTVPLYYTLAPSELLVDRDTLEREFHRIVEGAGVASIEALNRLLDRAETLKAVLKAPHRVDSIALHTAQHFRENVEPLGLKAFLVAVDREACALYKAALDKYLPASYSQVVYTASHKDNALLRQHHIDDDQEQQIRRRFRDSEELPKILIVTEKLLTGYDAPILYCMYLDKPLRDHTLLQAIARVNRPYPGKESGLIVDYSGIFEDLQRALAFDATTVQRGLVDIQQLRNRFKALMAQAQQMLTPIDLSEAGDRQARIIDHFFDPGSREQFIQVFKALQTAYEVLSPDPFLVDYLTDYALIAQVYSVVYNHFDPEAQKRRDEQDLLNKTDALIREHVRVAGPIDTMALYPINRDLATVIEADNVSERVKVINLYRSIMVHVEDHKDEEPYLLSIGEEVEAVVQALRDRMISAESALSQLLEKANQMQQASDEQQEVGLDGGEFAFYWVLKGQGVEEPEKTAAAIHALLARYPGWDYDQRLQMVVKRELYKLIRVDGATNTQHKVQAMRTVADNVLRVARVTRIA